MVDRDVFADGLGTLADVFGVRLSTGREGAYYHALSQDFTAESWALAVRCASRECERFPTPHALLGFRGNVQTERHECSLCRESPGWVWSHRKGGHSFMAPCPDRTDGRAIGYYGDRAEAKRETMPETLNAARASAQAMSRDEAKGLLGRVDPKGTLLEEAPF